MAESLFKFELPDRHRSIIKIVGVGGGGSNAVNHMFNQGIREVDFAVCNTDRQALDASPVPNKVRLGVTLTEGLGAGANPERGRDAAIESEQDIRELFSPNVKMVFITAGMGGGTGTGAAPVIARLAQERGMLTVAIVTAPFSFEGRVKKENAFRGIEELRQYCDTVLLILNDKLQDIYGDLPKRKAFAEADNILTNAAKSIAEIITVPGYVNVDFEDVKKVMKNAGQAVMGSATAQGENRARKAIEEALNSPLLNNRDIRGAKRILLTMFYSSEAEMTMGEQSIITNYINERTGDEVDELIPGDVIDENLGPFLRVTIIATGFIDNPEDGATRQRRVTDLESGKPVKQLIQPEPIVVPPSNRYEERGNYPPVPSEASKVVFSLEGSEPKGRDGGRNHGHGQEDPAQEDDAFRRQRDLDKRRQQLKNMSSNLSQDEFQQKMNVPAYRRKGVRLGDVPHSSERNVSRYTLDDDDQLLGNNRFLHDNVD
ncbi:MAG: Cell division protein FtsZ [uncultured Cytophagales bacterium]|uniref:Cell division protein FtsZ n=1 Tax=uncultured Cytophagales bacterium TaxID=158755 RepID=A0A6J4K362_9SPHI|nr:MAG: Cell division protein FtsZ [uncultured Cytophagales bacterium]